MNNVSQNPQVLWMNAWYKSLAIHRASYHFLRSSDGVESNFWKVLCQTNLLFIQLHLFHQIFVSWQHVSKPTTVIPHKPRWLFWTLVIFEFKFEFGQSDSQWVGVDIFLIGQILYWQGISSLKWAACTGICSVYHRKGYAYTLEGVYMESCHA